MNVHFFLTPVCINKQLASVNGATNAVEVISSNLVSSTYIGQGAGRYPTANSCVNDIVALAKGDMTPLPFNPQAKDTLFVNNYDSVFYIRMRYRDQVGITRQCGEICEKHGVSIHSILQNPVTKRDYWLDFKDVVVDAVQASAIKVPRYLIHYCFAGTKGKQLEHHRFNSRVENRVETLKKQVVAFSALFYAKGTKFFPEGAQHCQAV